MLSLDDLVFVHSAANSLNTHRALKILELVQVNLYSHPFLVEDNYPLTSFRLTFYSPRKSVIVRPSSERKGRVQPIQIRRVLLLLLRVACLTQTLRVHES